MKGVILSSVEEGGAVRVVISVTDEGRELGPFSETWGIKDDLGERLAGFVALHEYSRQNAIEQQEGQDAMLRAMLKAVDPEVVKAVLGIDDAKLEEITLGMVTK